MTVVAVTLGNSEVLADLVATNKGWVTVKVDGEIKKVRTSAVNYEPDLTGQPVTSRDVIPDDIRSTYLRGKTEEGISFIDSNDDIAQKLRGKPVIEAAKALAKLDNSRSAKGWIAFYTTDREVEGKNPLNEGMVRMNIGNRIRAALRAKEEEQKAA